MNAKPDIMEALSDLAREKDISGGTFNNNNRIGSKAAYRKNNKRTTGSPMNLTVRLTRQHGAQVFARKVVVNDVMRMTL